ncbi:MAG: hypothetical protein AAB766_05080 [Patescibacteria group bacterium]
MKVLLQFKWYLVIFMFALLTTFHIREASAIGLYLGRPDDLKIEKDVSRGEASELSSLPDIVLVPRLFTGNATSPATDKMILPKGSHVKVAVVVYAAVDTKVNLTRYCKSEVKKTKKDGTTTTSSESISTDVKVVGKTSVLLSWRQLEPSANGMCTLTVEVGDKKEIFTVYGEK